MKRLSDAKGSLVLDNFARLVDGIIHLCNYNPKQSLKCVPECMYACPIELVIWIAQSFQSLGFVTTQQSSSFE